ncbi:intermediate filament family protein [Mycolicibacterium arenosum]|uniref:Biofilm regulator BssS n=1 Tax=Mycolicibacterium arenosum TaxID=2952157 RepID=A0ABT1MD44_9MYCO|nr:hypothetical protein [Mycolicibacterium sp. CAU 1645]MCP9276480.1 hypothetical protein [Mycolicibacterium sp. CAU 1645]
MAEWNMLGALIGTLVAGPIGGPMGALAGYFLNGDDPPTHLPNKAPPYPGTTPGNPAFPGGPGSPEPSPAPPVPAPAPEHTPPPAPPRGGDEDSGAAADAADAESAAINEILDHLEELDKSAAATDEAVQRAAAQAKLLIADLQHDVEAKLAELGPRINTPDGQAELREFLKERLTTAKDALDKAIADAETAARETRERTQRYLDAARGDHGGGTGDDPNTDAGGTGSGATTPGGGGGSAGSYTDPGTFPASAATPPADAAPAAAPYGQSLMPGAGMMPGGMGMPSMPTFGGGGVPGFGGDPLGGLNGLTGATPHGDDAGFRDDSDRLGDDRGNTDGPVLHGGEEPTATPADDPADTGKDTGTEAAAAHSDDSATRSDDHDGEGDVQPVTEQTTTVALPDGTDVDARTTLGAKAVAAALHGAPVADAWQQAGVTVPPPGTPVTAPIPPTQLMAGDVGVWKDHLVMALGDGKVLVSGQVQPLTSVDSGPDFLGWMDPSAGRPGGDQAPPADPPAASPSSP